MAVQQAPLPTKDILTNIHLTAILNSNISSAVKKYIAVVFSKIDHELLYAWSLNSNKSDDTTESQYQNQNQTVKRPTILEPIAIEPALTIIRLSLKLVKTNEKLARSFDDVLQGKADLSQDQQTDDEQKENAVNNEVNDDEKVEEEIQQSNVNLQLLRTNYGSNKEIIIIPTEELLMSVVVSKF